MPSMTGVGASVGTEPLKKGKKADGISTPWPDRDRMRKAQAALFFASIMIVCPAIINSTIKLTTSDYYRGRQKSSKKTPKNEVWCKNSVKNWFFRQK